MSEYIDQTKKIMKELETEVMENNVLSRESFGKVYRLMEIIYNQELLIDVAKASSLKHKEEADALEAQIIFANAQAKQLRIEQEENNE